MNARWKCKLVPYFHEVPRIWYHEIMKHNNIISLQDARVNNVNAMVERHPNFQFQLRCEIKRNCFLEIEHIW